MFQADNDDNSYVLLELNWQVYSSTQSQQTRKQALNIAMACASRQASEDVCTEVVDKLLDVVDWVCACRSYGLFDGSSAAAAETTRTASPDKSPDGSPSRPQTEQPGLSDGSDPVAILPQDIWNDCLSMFTLNLPISLPIPSPIEGHIWHDLPHCYSFRPKIVDISANLSETFESGTVLTTVPRRQFENVIDLASASTHQIKGTSDKDQPIITTDIVEDSIDELGGSLSSARAPSSRGGTTGPVQSDISFALAAMGQQSFVNNVGTVIIDTSQSGGLDYGQVIVVPPQPVAPVDPKADAKGKDAKAAAVVVDTEAPTDAQVPPTTFNTPEWLSNVPPRYILGDAVINMRCAADPIPDLEHFGTAGTDTPVPTARDKQASFSLSQQLQSTVLYENMIKSHVHTKIPHFLCRVCVCSVSDSARKVVVKTLKQCVFGVSVIMVEELIMSAYELGRELTEHFHAMMQTVSSHHMKEGGKERTPKQLLAMSVYHALSLGEALTDEHCVCLLVQAITELPNACPGYVIGDFPNTKAQAVLLLQALSGINYDSHKPQPLDKASKYAVPPVLLDPNGASASGAQFVTQLWDTTLCGLDTAIFLDMNDNERKVCVDTLIEDRMCIRHTVENSATVSVGAETARRERELEPAEQEADSTIDSNREDAHKSTVFLTPANVEAGIVTSVESLQELYTPARPVHTCAIEYSIADTHQLELAQFLNGVVGIASIHNVGAYASLHNQQANKHVYQQQQLQDIATAIGETFAAKVMAAMNKDDADVEVMEDEGADEEGADGFDVPHGAGATSGDAATGGEPVLDGGADGMQQIMGELYL
jgi:hypothetical protein